MKKTLIALAVAASAAVSGSAMAWTEGELNGSVSMGGGIIPDTPVTWKWQLADAATLQSLDVNVADAKNVDGKFVFTNVVKNDFAILKGLTTKTVAQAAPGLAPVIKYTASSEAAGNDDTKRFVFDALNEKDAKIGTFKIDVRLNAIIVGQGVDGKKYYSGVADPTQSFGNGYMRYKTQYDAIGHDGFKNGIVSALGGDAPSFDGASASTGGISNVNVYSTYDQATSYVNWMGAYASVAKTGSGELILDSLTDKSWKIIVPVSVTYQ